MLNFDVQRGAKPAGDNCAVEVDPLTGIKVNKMKIIQL